jgi:hypothetical protein
MAVQTAYVLRDGLILSVVSCAYLYALMRLEPRIVLHDMPEDIQRAAEPWSAAEKRRITLLGLPYFVLVLAFPTYSAFAMAARAAFEPTFGAVFLHTYLVLLIANVIELVLLDLVVVCTLTPSWLVLPGTEGLPGWKDRSHQIRAHLRGAVAMAALAAIIGAAVKLV